MNFLYKQTVFVLALVILVSGLTLTPLLASAEGDWDGTPRPGQGAGAWWTECTAAFGVPICENAWAQYFEGCPPSDQECGALPSDPPDDIPDPVNCEVQTLSIKGLLACVSDGIVIPLINLLLSLAILVFLWGLVKYIYKADNDSERAKGKNLMLFGIIGLFVMVSMWGLVGILTGVFFGDASPSSLNPPIPQLPAGIIE